MALSKESICVQGGWQPKNGEARVLPIYQSTTFKYETSEEMGKLFDLEEEGYFYSRLQNPTCDMVAQKICDLEGGAAAMLTSSGQAATLLAVTNICEAGSHVICAAKVYGGTSNLLSVTLKRFGIETSLVDQDLPAEELEKYFKPNTRAVFAETISNPAGVILDIEKFVKLAHDHGVPMICDNTFATPINCQPFKFGVDIITHSTTKYLDGHAAAVGGAIVDSGNIDWTLHAEKLPGLTEPDESYHGICYAQKFGKGAYITKATVQMMRDLGSIQSPQNAFLLNLGMESLALRVARHCQNAQKIAEWLEADDRVSWVNYPGLPGNKYYALAQKYMPNGTCGVISFGVKGGRKSALAFMDHLRLASIVTHVADARTCVLHPASTTHRQLTDEQLAAAGVPGDMIRLSVGIEHVDDILQDLEQALQHA